jgi:chemosensory pili system protein ChpA (sensor histidine kinase/response regulator)
MMSSQTLQSSLPAHPAQGYVQQLENFFPQDRKSNIDVTAIEAYKALIAHICAVSAHMDEHEGMISLLRILQEGLDQIIQEFGLLTPKRLAFLARIPHLIAEHFQFPESKMPCSVMVRHMASNTWVRPLTMDEQVWFFDRITGDQMIQGEKTPAVVVSLPGVDISIEDQTADAAEISLDDFISVGAEQASAVSDEISLDDLITQAADLGEIIIEAVGVDEAVPATTNQLSAKAPSAKIMELVNLVAMELEEVVEFYNSGQDGSDRDMAEACQEAAVLADNIGNAVSLVGLDALTGLCNQLAEFFKQASAEPSVSTESLKHVIEHWPRVVKDYLRAGFDAEASATLLAWFEAHALLPHDDAVKADILHRLSHPVFPEESLQVKLETAKPEDVDLSLPEDVNPELLESLLQDLPHQTEALTHALMSMRDERDISQVEVAQRVAHTIKGSANVVGIRGLASLSHHLEDILENLTKAQQLPAPDLMNVLMESCDCIEAMSDALLGYDEAPDHAFDVLQTLLNWSNRINEVGLDEASAQTVTENASQSVQQATDAAPQARKTAAAPKENALRIPVRLADDLLRLAGENLIATGQIQDSIRHTLKKQGMLKNHNKVLQQLAFDLEHLIDIQGITSNLGHGSADENFDALELDEYHELHTISRRLIEISADSLALTNDLNQDLADLHNLVISHGVIQKENQELVLRTRMLPVKTIVPRLKRAIRQVCRLTGKNVDLDVIDNDVYLDSEVMNEIMEPLMHLLRNAVDHGIEPVEGRRAFGKPETGSIKILFTRIGDSVQIAISDDGQGMDANRIYSKAVQTGLIASGTKLSQDEIYRLVLQHGFSTRDEVTQISGRGVGLDVVSVKMRELKGSLEIESVPGQGCTFKLNLPISSFSTHSLLVRVRKYVYAISARGIEEILYPGAGKLVERESGLMFETESQTYHAVYMDNLFNLGADRRNIERSMRPILIVKDDLGGRRAVLVQDVLDSRHVVVKPLGMYLPRMNGVVGSTILGDGSIAPVVDLPELLLQSASSGVSHIRAINSDKTSTARRYVLVVDDSLSARRSLVQFVRDMGYEVREARDGMEAVSMIEQHKPGLVLADLEMPRMNGLELTAHIRANAETADLPVIMITSRSSDKHRSAAMGRGVNHFMVKPFTEDELEQHIHALLGV